MKLLIVVNKLLTGFDAPPATYLYIDKNLQNHGLFQAVCRVNRLDGDDKDYGYVIDYMDLFKSLEQAFHDYTTGKEKLDEALEAIKALIEPVAPPKDTIDFVHYFCGKDTANKDELKETEPRRVSLYKLTISLIRAYSNISDELSKAGYSNNEIDQIKADVKYFEHIR